MKLRRFASAPEFLEAVEPTLLKAEAENNLILGIAGDLAGDRMLGVPAPYFASVHDGEQVSVCAFSTVPDKVGLTQATHPAALEPLAADVIEGCPGMQVILGPEPTARSFAGRIAERLGTEPRLRMLQRIHELRVVEPQSTLPHGRLRPAQAGDLDRLTEWVAEFMAHAGDEGDAGAVAHDRIARGLLYVWEADRPVSMAAWTGRTRNGVRINFVYTPPELRGRGYATACVAGLTSLMLQTNRFCCLYTDLANPTSNAIYRRIGYRPVCDAAVYAITP